MSVTLQFDPKFSRAVGDWAVICGKDLSEAFRIQGRLLSGELIKRTPPFSGKMIMRMLDGRGAKASLETETELQGMTARNIGRRRVEKDIRRVIKGVNGAQFSAAVSVHRGQSTRNSGNVDKLDWGVLQRCEGKQAVRIFATKGGTVYGVDTAMFKPKATRAEMYATHQEHRLKSGRVTMAGAKTREVGRWRWVNMLVTEESNLKKFIARKQDNVGRAKAGWALSYKRLGGRISESGWVGKHMNKTGQCSINLQPYNVSIELVNRSEWAQNGDDERIIAKSMDGREIRIRKDIERILKERFK